MKKLVKEAKTIEEALEKIKSEENLTDNDFLFSKELIKGSLFKQDSYKLTAYKKEDIYDFVKIYLKEIVKGLGLDISLEVRTKDDRTTINMITNNNPILIGKNGQTIKALETLISQKVMSETGINFKIYLDIENYREKKDSRIIRLAKQTAKEVLKTNTPAILENLTSYERRLMHNALSEFKGIKTHSEGEEPNRNLVIESD